MWLSSSARRLHEPGPPTRSIIFIITDAVRSCPQTLHFYLERLATPRLVLTHLHNSEKIPVDVQIHQKALEYGIRGSSLYIIEFRNYVPILLITLKTRANLSTVRSDIFNFRLCVSLNTSTLALGEITGSSNAL